MSRNVLKLGFRSAELPVSEECREVIGRVFQLMSQDPDMGPKLRDADAPQRWEFPDLDLVVNVTSRGARARATTSAGSGRTTWTGSPRS